MTLDAPTPEEAELVAARLFRKLFRVEERPGGVFVLIDRRTEREVAGGWSSKWGSFWDFLEKKEAGRG